MMKNYLPFTHNLISCFGFCVLYLNSFFTVGQPLFTDVTEQAGINHYFEVFGGTFGGGAAVIDFNNDGWEDVFIAGGAGNDLLLENQGDGTFKDVTVQSGLSFLSDFVTQGAVVADVNKDGWPDLFVTTIAVIKDDEFIAAPNVLLINNQDGTFSDQSNIFRVVEATFSTGAAFGDVNKDGYPDLYVSNYFDNYEGNLDEFSGPVLNGSTGPGRDLLYINNSGRRFTESAETYGITRMGLTFQALWSDFDNDNDLDIMIANDFGNRGTPNLIYRNDFPEKKFTEIGAEMNFDYGINAMGIGAADINMDGWIDYLVTNIQVSPFFINQGIEIAFLDESVSRGTGYQTVATNEGFRVTPVSWGVNFFDVDLDMDQDLYITNGCLNPSIIPNPNLLLENNDGNFTDYSFFSNTNDLSIGRGSVVFDYDNDAVHDMLVVNQNPNGDETFDIEFLGTRLYRNENANSNNWIKIRLQGVQSESNGIGSRIEAYVGDNLLVREVYGGSSHESQNSLLVHFGLGQHTKIDSLVIKWSSMNLQVLVDVDANQLLTIEEENTILGLHEEGISKHLSEITVYPNPFNGSIYFDIPEHIKNKPVRVRLLNLFGQKLFDSEIPRPLLQKNLITVDQTLQPGMYIIVLEAENDIYSKVILKEN